VVFLSSSTDLCHDRFIPNPYQFLIVHSPYASALYNPDAESVVKQTRKKRRNIARCCCQNVLCTIPEVNNNVWGTQNYKNYLKFDFEYLQVKLKLIAMAVGSEAQNIFAYSNTGIVGSNLI
jgi:hypothetical protein